MKELHAPIAPRAVQVQWKSIPRKRWIELERGIDFEQDPAKAGAALRAWARRNGYRARTIVPDSNRLHVFIERDPNAKK